MEQKVLVSLCTRGRYDDYLAMALESLAMQTRKPDHITIFDDNDTPKDIREIPAYKHILTQLDYKGIGWNVVFGQKKGQHFNDEMANTAGYELVWRFDDDEVAEPNCLEEMLKEMKPDVGAVGCLVLTPPPHPIPPTADNKIDDMSLQNIQWFDWAGKPRKVEHLHSSFLYRAGIVHFDLRLSQVSFRGETMFSHSLFLKGFKLLVNPKAKVWHFQSQTGGCRTEAEEQKRRDMYNYDECIFRDWLSFKKKGKKLYVLNNGVGDHFMFRQVITPEEDAIIACCYPEIFEGYEIMSIADVNKYVDLKDYDIYKWCADHKWNGHLKDAFVEMYKNL